MNFSVPAGFITAAVVIAYTLSDLNVSAVLSKHAFVCVIGGTLAAAFVCCKFDFLFQMSKVFMFTVTGKRRSQVINVLKEIIGFAEHVNNGKLLIEVVQTCKNPFLRELLELSEQAGLDQHEFDEVVEKRLEQQNERYKRDAYLFKTIGKFPPAFGLVGTSVGMIGLLQGIGQEGAFQTIGPSMSIALVATFYGLCLSNFVLIPMGENLHLASEEDLTMRRIVVDGVKLLRDKRHPLLVQEFLISYLPPQERSLVRGAVSAKRNDTRAAAA